MKDKLNGIYKVKWSHNVAGDVIHDPAFTYSRTDFLMLRFKEVCETIIGGIASRGHVATVEEMEEGNGVIIMERWPNDLTIIKMHWVWIEKED